MIRGAGIPCAPLSNTDRQPSRWSGATVRWPDEAMPAHYRSARLERVEKDQARKHRMTSSADRWKATQGVFTYASVATGGVDW